MTWELGAHLGHLGRQLPVARALRANGHDVLFAVADTRTAAELLAPAGFNFVQAPTYGGGVRLRRPPSSYAGLLLAENYAHLPSLAGRVGAWLSLFKLYKPAVLVVDHSPTALLSTRIAGVPAVQFGNGFEIPPDTAPLPSIRPWEPLDEAHLRRSEERAVRAINSCIECFQSQQFLTCLADLFQTEAQILATFSELDHYGPRNAGRYAGALFSDVGTTACDWKKCDGRPRIFAYLHNGLAGLGALLEALDSLQADTVCFVSGMASSTALEHDSHFLRLLHRPVELSSLLPDADLVVCQGNMGLTARSLLAALPLLLVPGTAEQYMLASRVERIGAGALLGEDRTAQRFGAVTRSLLRTAPCRVAAARFADRYASYDPRTAIQSVTSAVNHVLGTPVH